MKKIFPFSLLLALCLFIVSCGENYITPPEQFMHSTIILNMDMNKYPFGQITIEQFVRQLQGQPIDGAQPQIVGWTADDEEYTLHARVNEEKLEFEFSHLLSEADGAGKLSAANGGEKGGHSLSGFQALKLVVGI